MSKRANFSGQPILKQIPKFITSNFELKTDMVAENYKRQWLTETMFQRLKQNFSLKYFLGDNQTAITGKLVLNLTTGSVFILSIHAHLASIAEPKLTLLTGQYCFLISEKFMYS